MQKRLWSWILVLSYFPPVVAAEERTQHFDRDPGWDAHNNRLGRNVSQEVRQDFGYSATRHAGGRRAGEIGGTLTPAAEPAYYAKAVSRRSFSDRLAASGKLACTGRHFHVLVGFFNAGTINEWRVPNSIVLRLYGRGDVFYAYVEYATSRWRAGADSPGGFSTVEDPATGRKQLKGFASSGKVHNWSISYDPAANNGHGSIMATIDDETSICHLDAGHKQDEATFNRFGLLNIPKHFDQGGEVWLDEISINGETENFKQDPDWDAVGNRRTYQTADVRPKFDFGFSATRHAGGLKSGELGGAIFRGDNREADKLAYYGDRLEPLSLDKPMRATGKMSMRRGISDSTTLIGFFHAEESIKVSESQSSALPMNFLGIAIEGPSREGFLVYPAYRFPSGADGYARSSDLPHILPDGASHDWSLDYVPDRTTGAAKLTLHFDQQSVELALPEKHRRAPANFNRFGIVTTWIDGNGQHIYLDDVTYTTRQD